MEKQVSQCDRRQPMKQSRGLFCTANQMCLSETVNHSSSVTSGKSNLMFKVYCMGKWALQLAIIFKGLLWKCKRQSKKHIVCTYRSMWFNRLNTIDIGCGIIGFTFICLFHWLRVSISLRANILKRKRNATLTTKMLNPSWTNFSLSDNGIVMSGYIPFTQYQNQNAVAYGYPAAMRILRGIPFLKSQSYKLLHYMNQYLFSKSKGETKFNQVILCFCQRSFLLCHFFNFWSNWRILSKWILLIALNT